MACLTVLGSRSHMAGDAPLFCVWFSIKSFGVFECRKYLRDADRILLSQLAFVYCLDALDQATEQHHHYQQQQQSVGGPEPSCDDDDDDDPDADAKRLDVLLLTYQVRQYTVKMQTSHSAKADQLLMAAYHAYIHTEVISQSFNQLISLSIFSDFLAWLFLSVLYHIAASHAILLD